MANYHAVYIDSPYSWTYNPDSYDSKLGFYSNAWLTNETEETSETPVISCSYFYELGKQDEVGFTPRRISMSESSGILTVEGKQENVSSLVSKSFRLNSPSPRFLNLRESMRKRRPARFIVNNIITDDDAELNNIKDYLGLNEEEAEAISRSEEFGAEMPDWWPEGTKEVVCPKCGARESEGGAYRSDPETTWPNGTPIDPDAIEADEHGWCDSCGGFELPDDFYEAEEFGAEAYEGFEQGNHHIQDKYFYELNERENEYWSGGQNQLNPIWGNERFINALITENINEEGYSPKFIVDFLLETLKQKEKELNIIQRRYKDENIKTFLRRNPFTSRRVMNPDFEDSNDNMTGMTPSEGWGSAWINIAIKSLNQEIDDVYERDMNRYGDMPDGAWDYVGELQEIRKQLRRDRSLVFGVPYNSESFGAEEFEARWVRPKQAKRKHEQVGYSWPDNHEALRKSALLHHKRRQKEAIERNKQEAESFEAKGSRKCTKHFWELASRKNPISGGMQFFNQCVLCGKKNFSRGGSAMSDRGFFAE